MDQLATVFHPIVDVVTGQIFAHEALLRARDPRQTQVMGAGQIINACEKLNLMHLMDHRARQTAIRTASLHLPENSRMFACLLHVGPSS